MGFRDYKNILVVGMARSGQAVSALLAGHGCSVTVWDDAAACCSAMLLETVGAAMS